MQRCLIGVLSPIAQCLVGLGSKHAIVPVTDRVMEEKTVLPWAQLLNSNRATYTTAQVTLTYTDIMPASSPGLNRGKT